MNHLSRPFQVFLGIPQGAHSSPLIINIFVNVLNDVFKNSTGSLYASDLKLYREILCPNDRSLLQADTDTLWQ